MKNDKHNKNSIINSQNENNRKNNKESVSGAQSTVGTKTIPYGRQNITDKDISAVAEALKSDYLTQGAKINEFEDEFANYVGSKYAVAVSNGTEVYYKKFNSLMMFPSLKNHGQQKVINTTNSFYNE